MTGRLNLRHSPRGQSWSLSHLNQGHWRGGNRQIPRNLFCVLLAVLDKCPVQKQNADRFRRRNLSALVFLIKYSYVYSYTDAIH